MQNFDRSQGSSRPLASAAYDAPWLPAMATSSPSAISNASSHLSSLDTLYQAPGWAISKARRFYLEEWERMEKGTSAQRPPYPYTEIIKMAILKSPHRRLTLSQLYADCGSKFPYFANPETSDGWKNTLRHNLSTQRYFIKLDREFSQPGKGHSWTYDADIELASMSLRKRRQLGVPDYSITAQRQALPLEGEPRGLGPRARTAPHSPILRSNVWQNHNVPGPPQADIRRKLSLEIPRVHMQTHRRPVVHRLARDSQDHRSRPLPPPPPPPSLVIVPRDRLKARILAQVPKLQHEPPRRSLSDHYLMHPISTGRR